MLNLKIVSTIFISTSFIVVLLYEISIPTCYSRFERK